MNKNLFFKQMAEGGDEGGMPDIATQASTAVEGALDWVGMSEIETPVKIKSPVGDGWTLVPARADAYVNLKDPKAKGIHMSRLYLHLEKALSSNELGFLSLQELVQDFVQSHHGLSDAGYVRVGFELPVRRKALKSSYSGWRSYPISLTTRLSGGVWKFELGFRVMYSSTCPCSAALARQLIQEQFLANFAGREQIPVSEVSSWLRSENGIIATPHSQRSHADILIEVSESSMNLDFVHWIDRVEEALKTVVQAAVKREDEQEFARLNGQNLMFCEDAARRVATALRADASVQDFWVRCSHIESLHPHDAVSIVTKGVKGGYSASQTHAAITGGSPK